MRLVHQLDVLLKQLDASDFDGIPQVERRRIAEQCRRAAELASPARPDAPRSGVLSDLRKGIPRHE